MTTSVSTSTTTPRDRRRRETIAEILDAAWELARTEGIASLSLRQLAKRVGMRAPSLYSYFDSKHAIYDAMFRQGQEQLAEHMADVSEKRPVTRESLKAGVRLWFEFCLASPVRYQLMFQRSVPGFEPSPESYSLAQARLADAGRVLLDAGVTDPAALDLWTALLTGLTSQQISNDPTGDRWARLLDESVDMFLDHVGALPTQTGDAP
ncbi:MAG: TetR/AcrR family transcriptional regulator [Acidimicrobiales bacterium]|nr:TetR/AcrR family transcriptional regulator [Acidimicrobiia bacterium]NNF54153.1 TetR/AcrR family transcriptional regulator [Acidimicrobiales bacterium]